MLPFIQQLSLASEYETVHLYIFIWRGIQTLKAEQVPYGKIHFAYLISSLQV
jgi:hypothetical protein